MRGLADRVGGTEGTVSQRVARPRALQFEGTVVSDRATLVA